MARFDVYRNAGRNAHKSPYLIDIQAQSLEALDSRVIIPLTRLARFRREEPHEKLMPVFSINGEALFLDTAKISAVPRLLLKERTISLSSAQHRIMAALDYLFHGY